MKRVYLSTFLTCITILAVAYGISRLYRFGGTMSVVTVGFIYESDESAPYTYNFSRSEVALQEEMRDSVNIITKNNVPDDAVDDMLFELASKGCNIIFTNTHSEQFAELAPSFPDVQICQISDMENPPEMHPDNYHTFNGRLYEIRYVSGVAAGFKLRQMIDDGIITPEEAIVGYVGAFPVASVISGYTAFLIGVRSVVPEAVMKVKYTNTWTGYKEEKDTAWELIREGCVLLSQHSDTIGPAVACEEASSEYPVVFVGCNKSLLDNAPSTALLSIRINWVPYVISAVTAVKNNQKIEKAVKGAVNGNDVSAGFEDDALEILDLNMNLAPKNTQKIIDSTIEMIKKDPAAAFRGAYTGVNPEDPSDTIDLHDGYIENAVSSAPSFYYLLKDVIRTL